MDFTSAIGKEKRYSYEIGVLYHKIIPGRWGWGIIERGRVKYSDGTMIYP